MAKHNKTGEVLAQYRLRSAARKLSSGRYARRFDKRHKVKDTVKEFKETTKTLASAKEEVTKLNELLNSNEKQDPKVLQDAKKRLGELDGKIPDYTAKVAELKPLHDEFVNNPKLSFLKLNEL